MIINWELFLWLTGIMLFAYWFIYAVGGPLSDDPKKVDERAILFNIPNGLATRRLAAKGLMKGIRKSLTQELIMTTDPVVRIGLIRDKRKDAFLIGREFFTWERSLLCPVCLHWWLTIIFAALVLALDLLHARANFLPGVLVYFVNHLIIRKIS